MSFNARASPNLTCNSKPSQPSNSAVPPPLVIPFYFLFIKHALGLLVTSASSLLRFWVEYSSHHNIQETKASVPSIQAHLRRCQRVWREVRSALLRANIRSCRGANRHRTPAPLYQAGQRVYLSSADLPPQVSSKKLAPRYVGPFPIDSVLSPTAVRLKLPAAMKQVHPVFHVSKIKPVSSSPLMPSAPAPPPPQFVDGHPQWKVRRLLKVRRCGRGFQYLADWEGYGPEERCWISKRLIMCPSLLRDFYEANPEAPGRPPGGAPRGGGTVMAHSASPSPPPPTPH
ncbi:uncharacterized protein LOC130904907 isoform X2 [Corythoichthys intestinalis]|uniref:uncharacterized protein LOC130904907 isoform X2 n=1 Tax=Corythoichthys intestinalis TaxID=161448 RepID=UPI0025A4EBEB|nr:uncharacterized protein LOC130904907 isoform X2 [Corythoichthys intestinalis]XP_057673993.1 uncharacterized protein LOC130904907 isoform X2 [Corythoichthys intestinalis]XP_057673994.1 uncharacterized protein LOC130904907 isoform X2 [Corythoichthys intestinalis]